ncbi:CaiD Enoyl-CoA hydratase/carnithine racemase [Acidimicrobiia bacterium]
MIASLSPAEALSLVSDGLDDSVVGFVSGRPLLAIDLDQPFADSVMQRLAQLLAPVPVIVVGVASETVPASPAVLDLDILLTDSPSALRPWVHCPEGTSARLKTLSSSIDRSPAAATALAQLLRMGESMTADEAIVAESFVYGLLQGNDDHRRWLAERGERTRKPRPTAAVVRVERDRETLVITLDRPEVRNAYGARMRDELTEAFRLVDVDPTIKRTELRGDGPAFCSGGDLDEFGTASDPLAAHMIRTTRSAAVVMTRIADRVTAFVHGTCVGAGVELPAFANEVIAHPDVTFLLPEISMGLVPGAGGTSSIPRRIGRHRTLLFALEQNPIDASTALGWGLIDRIDAAPFAIEGTLP